MSVSRRKFLRITGGLSALGWGANPLLQLWGAQLGASAGADWPRFGHDLHNTRFNDQEKTIGISNVERLKVKWQFDTDDNWTIQQTPAVVGDTLFFGSGRYQYALESATGKKKWRFDWGADGEWEKTAWQDAIKNRGTRSSPQYDNGRLYFGTGSTAVFCVDAATGRTLWRTRLYDDERMERMEAQIFYSPVVYKGKVFIGLSAGDATLFCLDAETGAIRWQFRIAQDVPVEMRTGGGSLWTSGAIDESTNTVYNVTGSNKSFFPNLALYSESILAHDADTGELLWYYQAHPQDAFDLDFCAHPMILDAIAPARIRGDVRHCVAAATKDSMFCWNRHTGDLYWRVMIGRGSMALINATAAAYNKVYVMGSGGIRATAALNAYNGNIEWIAPNEGPQSAPLAVANGVLYQGLLEPAKLQALDASSGRKLWEFPLPSEFRGGFAIANGAVYAGNGEPTSWGDLSLPYKHSMYCFTIDGK